MSRKGYIICTGYSILTDIWRGSDVEGVMEYYAGVRGDPTISNPDVQVTNTKNDAIFYGSVEKAENEMKKFVPTQWEIVPYDSTETKGGA